MIGGHDLAIPTAGKAAALDVALRIMRRHWPSAVFEDALTGDRYLGYKSIPVARLSEVFTYRDNESAAKWECSGATHELAGTMVHLLLSSDSLTLVMDEPLSLEMAS